MAITIRRAEPGDYELVCEVFADESAYSGTLQAPFPSKERWRKFMAEPSDRPRQNRSRSESVIPEGIVSSVRVVSALTGRNLNFPDEIPK